MSWQATAWGQRQTTGSSGRKALLLVLANYADDQGICWPSQETLAKDTEQSVDTVQRQLRKLAELGLIEIMKRQQGRGRWPRRTYRLNMLKSTGPQNAARRAEEAPCEFNGSESRPQPARDQAATSSVTEPQALRHEPSIEPTFKPSWNLSAANSKPKLSAAERQQAFQRKRQPIEVIQSRVAARLGGEGWEILQGTSDTELHRLTSLEERGKLDETMLEAIRFKYRQRGI